MYRSYISILWKSPLVGNVSSLSMVVNPHPCWSLAQSPLTNPSPSYPLPMPSSCQHNIYLHTDDINDSFFLCQEQDHIQSGVNDTYKFWHSGVNDIAEFWFSSAFDTPESWLSGLIGDLNLEYFSKFPIVFKNILRCETVAWGRRLMKKSGVGNSCKTVPLRKYCKNKLFEWTLF